MITLEQANKVCKWLYAYLSSYVKKKRVLRNNRFLSYILCSRRGIFLQKLSFCEGTKVSDSAKSLQLSLEVLLPILRS